MYYFITIIRNFLFDKNIIRSRHYDDVFVLCVGNLRVGGTGKTPMVEYLVNNLKDDFHLAVVSLGYGRKTKGLRQINKDDTVLTVGDEPLQMFNKFSNIPFFVSKDRNIAIDYIRNNYKDIKLIILDDALQYRKTRPNKTILLTEYARPFYKDMIMPYGRLRESKSAKKRADYIVVTKCPDIKKESRQEIIKNIKPTINQSVYFSQIRYTKAYNYRNKIEEDIKNKNFLFVAGIDNPIPAINYMKSVGCNIELLKYNDHHAYSDKDIKNIKQKLKPNQKLITTEKDAMRLSHSDLDFLVLAIENTIDDKFLNNFKYELHSNIRS